MDRQFATAAIVGICIMGVICFPFGGCGPSGAQAPSLVGLTEQQVLKTMGSPANTFGGHYGSRTQAFAGAFPNVRTHVFEVWDGTVYVTIDLNTGTCITADHLPPGGQF